MKPYPSLSLVKFFVGVVFGLGYMEANAQTVSQTPSAPPPPAQAVITITHIEQPYFDLPASADVINNRDIQSGQRQINLSESLARVPGLRIQDRQNYAQDLQISSRGFGARTAFGVRGIRLFTDGIPATLPDGQGQISHFPLSSAERIEVLRGPFSVLQGNSSGGVISLTTANPPPGFQFAPSFFTGSDNTWRVGTQVAGADANKSYLIDIGRFHTDGYRQHSSANRDTGNVRISAGIGEATRIVANINAIDQRAEDPLGVSRASWQKDPRAIDDLALLNFNTRKTLQQTQGGLTLDHQIDSNSQLKVTGYGGQRGIVQYQAIPFSVQSPLPPLPTSPTSLKHPGGVIDLERNYYGFDARYIRKGFMKDSPWIFTVGLTSDQLDEQRKGYNNFTGNTGAGKCGSGTLQCGVQGAPRRNENNEARTLDPYLEGVWEWAPGWRSTAGLRYSQLKIDSRDRITSGNPERLQFHTVTPALGLVRTLNDQVNTYISWGRGWEAPTLNELAYRPDGRGGLKGSLNTDLGAATSSQLEWGVKAKSESVNLNAAIFTVNTNDEIVVAESSGGRTAYQNAKTTKRNGLELGGAWRLAPEWNINAAFTYLSAYYSEAFKTCPLSPIPCIASNKVTIPFGKRLPGVPKINIYADLVWHKAVPGMSLALESRWVDRVWVDDLNTDSARPYGILNARIEYSQKVGAWDLRTFARVDNIADIQYIGSVIVNDANSRFFEPAPGRNYTLGATARYQTP